MANNVFRGSYIPENTYVSGGASTYEDSNMEGLEDPSGSQDTSCSTTIYFFNTPFSFLATLNILYFSWLANEPIQHQSSWLTIPTKFPYNILKFDSKLREEPSTHVMAYHLWCSLNSLVDDSIWLRIFKRTLTGNVEKWYIVLLGATYRDFSNLTMDFLTHFQLPIQYKNGTGISIIGKNLHFCII
jgi:hypothetical protein